MKEESVQEIIDCFQNDRMLFYYFKDKYALMLLSSLVEKKKQISRIRERRFGKLLQKPIVKGILKNAGDGFLTKRIVDSVWPQQYECYLLSLAKWGDSYKGARFWNQTSRPGANLVLQLNFSRKHNNQYYKLISPEKDHPFEYYDHPISKGKTHTLAWARIDLDYDNNQALIEEIQNDWIREAMEKKALAKQAEDGTLQPKKDLQYYKDRIGCHPKALLQYIDQALAPHTPLWDEAVLSAAIWFIKKEIGIKNIFYHTFKTGCELKRIKYGKPPKSIYYSLPEKFCFKQTKEVPVLLLTDKNKRIKKLIKTNKLIFYSLKF